MSPSPNPFADEPLPERGPRLESAGDVTNPYAAPVGVVESRPEKGPGVGIWRFKALVVIHQSLDLPERCIWTNEPGVYRGTAEFHWSAWLGLSQGSIKFAYSLSRQRQRRKLLNELWSLGILALGGGLLFLTILLANVEWQSGSPTNALIAVTALLGIFFLLVGWNLFRWHSQPLSLFHREGPYFLLRGAGEPFLRSLRPWPGLYATDTRSP